MADLLNLSNLVRFDASGKLYSDSIKVDGATIVRDSSTGELKIGTVPASAADSSGLVVLKGSFTGATGAGGALNLQQTSGSARTILRATARVTSAAGVESTINLGTGPTASTDYDDLIDGADANVAANYGNIQNPGSNGKPQAMWKNNEYLSATLSAGPGSFAGTYIIIYTDSE